MASRRQILGTSLCLLAAPAMAQAWPPGPVKLVVPLTPGSGADTAARTVAQVLHRTWKQSVVVENRPGAGGLIGTSAVVAAEPTGQTLLVQSVSYAANPAIFKTLPYDPHSSLAEVAFLGVTPYVLVTTPAGPFRTLAELVAAAKASPGQMPFASVGVGSSTHFAAEAFAQAAGVRLLHVPYKGGPEAIQEVMAGRAAFTMASLSTAMPHIQAGKLRALGLSTRQRSPAAADTPTIAEQGYGDFDISLWFGVWAPAGTPAAIVQRIHDDILRSFDEPEVQQTFGRLGIQVERMDTAAFRRRVHDEIARHKAIAQAARIEPL